jgi:hypothetical protein
LIDFPGKRKGMTGNSTKNMQYVNDLSIMVRETISNRVYREVVAIGVNVDIICESAGVVINSTRELNNAGEIKGG